MSTERPPYLPEVPEQPELHPRTEYVPTLRHTPPVDAGSQSDRRPDNQTVGHQWVEVFNGTLAESHPTMVESEPPAPTGEAAAEPEAKERERVQLAGRLGQDPKMRTTPKGTLIASFPLGVKDEANLDKTTWHTVLAFQKRAEQVRDTLKKGDPVEVIGYVHEREIPRRDGSTRTVREVYATIIKQR